MRTADIDPIRPIWRWLAFAVIVAAAGSSAFSGARHDGCRTLGGIHGPCQLASGGPDRILECRPLL